MMNAIQPYLLPLVIIAILGWRMSRSMRGRPINPSYLWIRPAIVAVLVVLMLAISFRFDAIGLAAMTAAIMLGVGAGYLLSYHQELTLDRQSGKIISKTSPVGVVLFVGLFAARMVFRVTTTSGRAPDSIAAHSRQIMFYSDLAFVFLFELVAAQAWEIWRRTRPLVAEQAAAKSAPEPTGD
jgi:hypothetical protein